jgi:hypothetical protein
MISSSSGINPPDSTPVHWDGPPMERKGTADRAPGSCLANQSRGLKEELPINSKDYKRVSGSRSRNFIVFVRFLINHIYILFKQQSIGQTWYRLCNV